MPDMWLDVDAAVTVHVNLLPLLDDTDFKTIEEAVAYNAAGMDLNWNFVTSAGVITQTNVVPTTGGDYDWTHVGNGIYKIEIPASGGASVNNDSKGYGWFAGVCDGVLPFSGPRIGFRASALNDLLCDSAYSVTRGLAGTALPDAAANGVGGLPVSATGGLDMDAIYAGAVRLTAARAQVLDDWINDGRLDLLIDAIKAKSDGLNFTGDDVKATLDGEQVVTDAASRMASKATGYAVAGDKMDLLDTIMEDA